MATQAVTPTATLANAPLAAGQFDEQKLIRAGQRGDSQAVEALFRRYQRPLFQTALRVLGNAEDAEDALQDATQGGAHAIRQGRMLGSLQVGKKADLIVLDTMRAHLVPAGRIVSAWIHNGQPSDIETVMIDGRFVMRDRKVLTMDEAAIIAEADKVGRRIWNKVKAAGPIPIPGRAGI